MECWIEFGGYPSRAVLSHSCFLLNISLRTALQNGSESTDWFLTLAVNLTLSFLGNLRRGFGYQNAGNVVLVSCLSKNTEHFDFCRSSVTAMAAPMFNPPFFIFLLTVAALVLLYAVHYGGCISEDRKLTRMVFQGPHNILHPVHPTIIFCACRDKWRFEVRSMGFLLRL